MSEYTVKLPDVGEGVAEAEIVEWHVAVGDLIDEDAVLVDVMSDKATIELPSPVSGTVRWVGGDVGDVLAVGSPIVVIDIDDNGAGDGPGADAAAPPTPAASIPPPPLPTPAPAPASASSAPSAPSAAAAAETGPGEEASSVVPSAPSAPSRADRPVSGATARPTAAAAVRARATQLGIDLADVAGSGPDGRVTHADLDAQLRSMVTDRPASARRAAAVDEVEDVRITGLRRNIAERMQASKRRIPHFTYVEEIDVTDVERLRSELNDGRGDHQPKLSLLPFLMRAVVLGVRAHPQMNSRFDDEAGVIRRHRSVHLGIAAQTERGLMVPVVHHADTLDLWDTASEVARLAEGARTAKISLDDLSGSTITITSLGALGGIVSTPVINAPEVAIVGVNKIVDRPTYLGDALVRRKQMNLSSSFDHRVIDGADAAAFIQTIKRLIEHPALLFIDAP